jgi:hypothetical protein
MNTISSNNYDNINNLLNDSIYRDKFNNLIENDELYIELSNKCNDINKEILEKRYKNNFRNNKYSYRNNYDNKNNYDNTNNYDNKNNYDNTNNLNIRNNSKYPNEKKSEYNQYSNNGKKHKFGYKSYYNKNFNKYNNYNQDNDYTHNNNYLTINRHLNKLSINNFDIIIGKVLETVGMYAVNEINEYVENYNKFAVKFRGDDNMIESFNYVNLYNEINNYVDHIILTCLKKTFIQSEQYKVFFKFIQTIQNVNITNFRENILKRVYIKYNEIIFINDKNKFLDEEEKQNITQKINLKMNEFKNKINNIEISKQVETFKNDIKEISVNFLKYKVQGIEFNSIIFLDKLQNIINKRNINKQCNIDLKTYKNEVIFNLLGYFNKYFFTSNKNKLLFNEYLLVIYENFKFINELLIWEPLNSIELENRIYFTIGFIENNNNFIKNLNYDFFQDIESELETIKKSKNIPITVKYKLLDIIDNFIQSRYNNK